MLQFIFAHPDVFWLFFIIIIIAGASASLLE